MQVKGNDFIMSLRERPLEVVAHIVQFIGYNVFKYSQRPSAIRSAE